MSADRLERDIRTLAGFGTRHTLSWSAVDDPDLAGYKLYWRETAAPQWQTWRFVPKETTRHTIENIIIDNYLFGVAAVGEGGNESPVVYPGGLIR